MRLVLVAVVVYVCKLVLDREYAYWGGRFAERLCRLAACLSPLPQRDVLMAEWLGELDEIQRSQGHAGLVYALGVVLAGARLRVAPSGRRVARRAAGVEAHTRHALRRCRTVLYGSAATGIETVSSMPTRLADFTATAMEAFTAFAVSAMEGMVESIAATGEWLFSLGRQRR